MDTTLNIFSFCYMLDGDGNTTPWTILHDTNFSATTMTANPKGVDLTAMVVPYRQSYYLLTTISQTVGDVVTAPRVTGLYYSLSPRMIRGTEV